MRLPNAAHESRPWRIREIVPDFTLEDVWALPVVGGREDFEAARDLIASFDPADADSLAARFLWQARDRLGRWFGLGSISAAGGGPDDARGELPIPGTDETSLADRLPDDLLGTASHLDFGVVPFTPLYLTDTEFAAEISNRTVHGVLHLAWADREDGEYGGQLAIYVKPRGAIGHAYMAFIKPFRYLIVYPALMRQIERIWDGRAHE